MTDLKLNIKKVQAVPLDEYYTAYQLQQLINFYKTITPKKDKVGVSFIKELEKHSESFIKNLEKHRETQKKEGKTMNKDEMQNLENITKKLLSIKLSDLCNLNFYIDFENDNDAFVEMLDIKYLKDEDTILNFILSNAKFSIYNKKHILQTLIELLEKNYKFSNNVKNSIKKHFENKKRTKLDKLNAIAHELSMSCVDCKNLDNCKIGSINYPCKKIKGILNNER